MPSAYFALLQILLVLAASVKGSTESSDEDLAKHCNVKQFEYDEHSERGIRNCFFAPSKWHLIHSWCRDIPKNRQSPIRVNLNECRRDADEQMSDIWLSDAWYYPQKFIVHNNGYTLKAEPVAAKTSNRSESKLKISGAGLNGLEHEVLQLHMHWGSRENMLVNGKGSEHELYNNDTKYSTMDELHIVTARAGLEFSKAAVTSDAIVVLASFFTAIENTSSENSAAENAMRTLLKDLPSLRRPVKDKDAVSDAGYSTVELRLRDLLPKSLGRMVGYSGSLTTPSCSPVVKWRLFPDVMPVKTDVLTELTSLCSNTDCSIPLVNNFRPVMLRHNRKILCTFDGRDVHD